MRVINVFCAPNRVLFDRHNTHRSFVTHRVSARYNSIYLRQVGDTAVVDWAVNRDVVCRFIYFRR